MALPRNPSSNAEWWRGAVIYQIYPRSFMDATGDGVGDLPGMLQKLEYVAKLGVEAIWISPFFKSPMKDFGYDISDYRDVDPVFGTLEDFKSVLERAHELGLKVLIDQVWSHTSDQHEWFRKSRQSTNNDKSDWYIWRDPKADGTVPNNWMSWFGGAAWTWDARRRQYYLHHFLPSQPTLNYWNPEVRQAIKDTAKFWLDIGVDGFRLDVATMYFSDKDLRDNPPRGVDEPFPDDAPLSNPMVYQRRLYSVNRPENLDWLGELRAFINQWPNKCFLAEPAAGDSEKVAALYTEKDKRCHMAYSFGLLGSNMSKEPVMKAVSRFLETIGDGWICWVVSNHDFKRVASRLEGEVPLADKALFATALALSLKGSYCMYQGEELGLPQADLAFEDIQDPYDRALYPEHVGRDGGRTPMPWMATVPQAGFSTAPKTWLPISPSHLPLAVDAQENKPDSVLNKVRTLLALRKESTAMRLGDMEIIEVPDPLFAIRRFDEAQSVIAVFNCSPERVETKLPFVNEGTHLVRRVSHNARISNGLLTLEPYAFGFIRQ